MKLAVTFGVVSTVAIVAGTACAELPDVRGDQFMRQPPKETVYATERHMGFSIRSSLIQWLGGVTIVDENDMRASERETWWGKDVPLVPADVVKGSER